MNIKLTEKKLKVSMPTSDAKLIAAYRAGAAQRRAKSKLLLLAGSPLAGVQSKDGVVTVTMAPGAKPVSKLGGVAKVFGRSKISIPEYKR